MNHNDIYLSDNPSGFKINVNNPKINKLYRRYKRWKGLPETMPISNKQRFEFEKYIIEALKKNNI